MGKRKFEDLETPYTIMSQSENWESESRPETSFSKKTISDNGKRPMKTIHDFFDISEKQPRANALNIGKKTISDNGKRPMKTIHGVLDICEKQPRANALNIGKLNFADFTGTKQTFRHLEGVTLSFEHRILLDNVWVAATRRDLNHSIACINGLALTLRNDKSCFVVTTGTRPGIYKDRVSTSEYMQGQAKPAWKKFDSFREAFEFCNSKWSRYYICPELIAEAKKLEESEDSTKILELKKKLMEAELKNIELEKVVAELRRSSHNQEVGMSYAGAHTKEDRIYEALDHVQHWVRDISSRIEDLTNEPPKPWMDFFFERIPAKDSEPEDNGLDIPDQPDALMQKRRRQNFGDQDNNCERDTDVLNFCHSSRS